MQTARSGGGAGAFFAPGAVVKGTLFSLGVAFFASLLLSFVVYLADWEDPPATLTAFHYISIGLGGVLAARSARRLGWLHGGLVGVVYTLVLTLLFAEGGSVSAQLLAPKALYELLWGFIAGVAGGALGVNAS